MFQVQILSDYEALSQLAAQWIVERIRAKPSSLLCLAAGSTPRRTYESLASRGTAEPHLFNQVKLIKLDEWGGLAMDDPATCEFQLRTSLVMPLGLSERYTAFASDPPNPVAECARIAEWLKENGPIDVSVLGLGINGHLGFNEPAEVLNPRSHVAKLSDASLTHEMLDSSGARPTYGLTLGMADLLEARQVLLLVSGTSKRRPLCQLLSSDRTMAFPASMLRLHPNVTLLCDSDSYEGAAEEIALRKQFPCVAK